MRDERVRFRRGVAEEVDVLRSALDEAESSECAASDVVRHLQPTEESARSMARGQLYCLPLHPGIYGSRLPFPNGACRCFALSMAPTYIVRCGR